MLADLPEPRRHPLPQAPVELVVWQLQFAEAAPVGAPATGPALAARLTGDGEGAFQLQRLNQPAFSISLGAAVPGVPQAAPQPTDGWVLRRGPLTITVAPAALTVETYAFSDWPSFRALVDLTLQSLVETVLLPGEQRLGLRYVDHVVHAGVRQIKQWSELLAPWLVGPLAHAQLGDAVAAHAQQVDFEPDPTGTRATVRQRVFADADRRGRPTAILDFDVFREGYRLVEPEEVLRATDHLDDLAHRLFEASITETLYTTFANASEPQ